MTKKMVMPWEDRPAGCADVMWRYSKNPVIDRYHIPSSNSIFNSAVVPFEDGFAGVFRCENKAVQMNIFAGSCGVWITSSLHSSIIACNDTVNSCAILFLFLLNFVFPGHNCPIISIILHCRF